MEKTCIRGIIWPNCSWNMYNWDFNHMLLITSPKIGFAMWQCVSIAQKILSYALLILHKSFCLVYLNLSYVHIGHKETEKIFSYIKTKHVNTYKSQRSPPKLFNYTQRGVIHLKSPPNFPNFFIINSNVNPLRNIPIKHDSTEDE